MNSIFARHTGSNLILATDSYKVSHWRQYPREDGKPRMTYMSDYFTSRGGKYKYIQFIGLQYYLIAFLSKRISKRDVDEASVIFAAHFGNASYFPYDGWMKVVTKYNGRLPIRIRALPEGMVVPVQTPLFVVESMDPELFWLVSWVEGILQKVWYPTTVATADFHTKLELWKRAVKTQDNPNVDFQLHDFGYRGASSDESAAIGGGAALLNFLGTDTVPALTHLMAYYGAELVPGFSIAASEHSTMTTWGLTAKGEKAAFLNMIHEFGKGPIFACVSDSRNIFDAVSKTWGEELRAEVVAMPATLVIRPDSGDPVEIVTEIVRLLDQQFGSTINGKGYKVLNKVRVIQGDGIGHDGVIGQILDSIIALGFSSENVAFGMGGGRLQKFDRDTQKFAIKCSLAEIDGELVEVFKDPVTDPGKKSHKGYVDVIYDEDGEAVTIDGLRGPHPDSLMSVCFEHGVVLIEEKWADIRARAQAEFTHTLRRPYDGNPFKRVA